MTEIVPLLLVLSLFGVVAVLAVMLLQRTTFRPIAALILIPYIPLQNVLLPALGIVAGMAVVTPLLPFKEIVVGLGLAGSLRRGLGHITLRAPDVLGGLLLLFLIINAAWSPADVSSAGYGIRAYSVPVLLYAFGRLSNQGEAENTLRLLRLVLLVGTIVVLFSLVEHALYLLDRSPFTSLWNVYRAHAYGHGTTQVRELGPRSASFLWYKTLTGPFGNNLVTAAFLRSTLFALLAYLAYRRTSAGYTHFAYIILTTVVIVLTLSRFAIAVALLVLIILLFSKNPLWRWQKLLTAGLLIASTMIAYPMLRQVIAATVTVRDESTYVHVTSLEEIRQLSPSLHGSGLGTGAHSPEARRIYRTSKGEGLFRQGLPEIGIIGVGLVLIFAGSVIVALLARSISGDPYRRGLYAWIAAPLVIELLHTPLDIGIRSFLGSGLAWFLAGWFVSEPIDNGP